jgi:hypothetical protein
MLQGNLIQALCESLLPKEKYPQTQLDGLLISVTEKYPFVTSDTARAAGGGLDHSRPRSSAKQCQNRTR